MTDYTSGFATGIAFTLISSGWVVIMLGLSIGRARQQPVTLPPATELPPEPAPSLPTQHSAICSRCGQPAPEPVRVWDMRAIGRETHGQRRILCRDCVGAWLRDQANAGARVVSPGRN
jgi:hypothetical protein